MNYIEIASILGAAFAVAFGAIGPALAEGRAVAAAMDAIARQPEAADRDDGDLLSRDRAPPPLRQPLHSMTP